MQHGFAVLHRSVQHGFAVLSAAKPSAENSHYGSSGVGFENPNDQKPLYKRLNDKFHYTRTGARAPAGAQNEEAK